MYKDKTIRIGEREYRLCYARPYMLSLCFYCSFSSARDSCRRPSWVDCRERAFYFKRVRGGDDGR